MSAVVAIGSKVDRWARRIAGAYQSGVESVLAVGRELLDAKADCSHGEWQLLTGEGGGTSQLPFGASTAQRFMAIAKHRIISNPAHVQDLPLSWGTLYQLALLPHAVLQAKLDAGEITPELRRVEVEAWLAEHRPEPVPLPISVAEQPPRHERTAVVDHGAGWAFDFATGRCLKGEDNLQRWLDDAGIAPDRFGWKRNTDGSLALRAEPEVMDRERAASEAQRIIAARGKDYAVMLGRELLLLGCAD